MRIDTLRLEPVKKPDSKAHWSVSSVDAPLQSPHKRLEHACSDYVTAVCHLHVYMTRLKFPLLVYWVLMDFAINTHIFVLTQRVLHSSSHWHIFHPSIPRATSWLVLVALLCLSNPVSLCPSLHHSLFTSLLVTSVASLVMTPAIPLATPDTMPDGNLCKSLDPCTYMCTHVDIVHVEYTSLIVCLYMYLHMHALMIPLYA